MTTNTTAHRWREGNLPEAPDSKPAGVASPPPSSSSSSPRGSPEVGIPTTPPPPPPKQASRVFDRASLPPVSREAVGLPPSLRVDLRWDRCFLVGLAASRGFGASGGLGVGGGIVVDVD